MCCGREITPINFPLLSPGDWELIFSGSISVEKMFSGISVVTLRLYREVIQSTVIDRLSRTFDLTGLEKKFSLNWVFDLTRPGKSFRELIILVEKPGFLALQAVRLINKASDLAFQKSLVFDLTGRSL